MKLYYKDDIAIASHALKAGELVAFPTETVYGLGAIANSEEAVRKVFMVKGRPSDNPLIVHVASPQQAMKLANLTDQQKEAFNALTSAFWPGPLTLVVPVLASTFAKSATGGLQTVGMRMPDQPMTLKLIEEVGFPLVGPSANISGKPSPTEVAHVLNDFNGKIAGILVDQDSRIGVESTVLDLCETPFTILRPGKITLQDLQYACPNFIFKDFTWENFGQKDQPKAPGMKYRHYSPKQPVLGVSAENLMQTIDYYKEQNLFVAATKEVLEKLSSTKAIKLYSLGENSEQATHNLYKALRDADQTENISYIIVELLPDEEGNQAYRNRLEKASSKIIE